MIKVFAEGRVAKDAKVFEYGKGRDTKTGVGFGLICNRFYNDENPTYIQCTIFGPDEKTAQYITTGRQMVIHGNLSRNEEGYYSVTVDDFSFGQVPNRDRNDDGKRNSRDERDNYGGREAVSGGGRGYDGEGSFRVIPDGIDEELPFN